MLLLGFLLVIAASLTLWAALTLNDHSASALAAVPEPQGREPQGAERPTNDEVRGARARVTQRQETSDDAFERFLRSDAKRDESDF